MEFKGTKGKWSYFNNTIEIRGIRGNIVICNFDEPYSKKESDKLKENAELIAEAGNIRQQIPFSLTELKNQHNEMLEMLEKVYKQFKAMPESCDPNAYNLQIEKLINEATKID